MVLGVVLGLWLLLMGIGAWLGRTADKLRRPLAALAVIQMLVAVLPLAQVFLLRALRNVVFIRGAAVGVTETVGAAFVLLLPYCLVAGYALTLACAILARQQGAAGIGRAYVADSIGSIIGGGLFSFVLVRSLDHIAILIWPALLNLLVAALLAWSERRARTPCAPPTPRDGAQWSERPTNNPLLPTLAALLGLGLSAAALLCDLDGLSTRLQYPRQHIVARAKSPYGKLIVTESDGQFDFLENGIPITSTRDDQHVEETVHYAMAQRPEARRVLLVSGGISGTAREILKYGVPAVDYVELDPLILALGKRFLPANLADGRIRVINTDGRLFVKQTPERYDVVIIGVPAPATAQLNRFYTAEFLAEVKRVLARDGVVCFALGQYENYVSPELARMLSSACLAVKQSFRNVLVIPGGRVFFLASDGPLYADIAARIEQRQHSDRSWSTAITSTAMLTADRMADLASATAQPAAMNRDFSPVLYYYHLRHWMSQFNVRFGLLQVGLVVLLGFYLVRLRGKRVRPVRFGLCGLRPGSGFAAGLSGPVRLGLSPGGRHRNRLHGGPGAGGPHSESAGGLQPPAACLRSLWPSPPTPQFFRSCCPSSIAWAAGPASLVLVKVTIALLTLVLAALVGMQFPLANRLEFDGTVAGASRLYTADFVGAFLGALLACTLLIPLIGVFGVCWLTAALNVAAGLVGGRRMAAA